MWCYKCNLDHGLTACHKDAPPLFIVNTNAGTLKPTLNPLSPVASPMLDPVTGGLKPQFQTTPFGQMHIMNGGKLAPK